MSTKKIIFTLVLAQLSCFPVFSQWKSKEFLSPGNEYRAQTWYHWQNGHIGKDAIKADLESMKEVGLGGFYLFTTAEGAPEGPAVYMEDEWWDAYRFTQREAKSLGLEMGIMNGSGWSVSGGPWVKPEDAMQEVAWTEEHLTGPVHFKGRLPEPLPCLGLERDMQKDPLSNRRYYVPREQVAGYFHDIAVLAFPTPEGEKTGKPYHIKGWWDKAGFSKMNSWSPDHIKAPEKEIVRPGDMIDLTDLVGPDGSLEWDVPEGTWTILRIGYQPTGRKNHPAAAGGSGLEVDKLSAAALDRYWEASTGRLLEDSDHVTKVLIDSYEAGHQNWTSGFEKEFRKRMGYDLRFFLPAVTGRVVSGTDETERFLWDYRKVISDLLIENYYDRFAELSHKDGRLLAIEPYGQFGNTDEFSTGKTADILSGEFWAGENAGSTNRTTMKLASSLSHVYGKEIVGAEAFTNSGRIFEIHPGMLKTQGDYYFCLGMNQVWLHSYVHDPYGKMPGMTLGSYGTHFNRRNTWWEYSRPWFDYLARCQYMLRQGKSSCPILYYMGEDAPSRPPKSEDLVPAIPAGYDYDFCGGSEILSLLKAGKGTLTAPSGTVYNLLVIRSKDNLQPATLHQIEALSKAGAIICYGPEANIESTLRSNGVLPDVEINLPAGYKAEETQYPGCPVTFTHRTAPGRDVFFVSNQQVHKKVAPTLLFNVRGKAPEVWNPKDGSIHRIHEYEITEDGRIRMNLPLEESEALFVVFRMPLGGKHRALGTAGRPEPKDVVTSIGQGWEISLLPGFSGNGKTIEADTLANLSGSEDPEVKYFSGSILYRNHFTANRKKGQRFTLDLGEVAVVAQVRINGRDVGTLWCEPFRCDISEYVHVGENTLEIKVVNLLYNRVAGDLMLPEDCEWTDQTGSTASGFSLARIPSWVVEGKDSPTGRKTFTTWKWPYMKGRMLPPSGLIGPVTVSESI